jgi:hypothetical protein
VCVYCLGVWVRSITAKRLLWYSWKFQTTFVCSTNTPAFLQNRPKNVLANIVQPNVPNIFFSTNLSKHEHTKILESVFLLNSSRFSRTARLFVLFLIEFFRQFVLKCCSFCDWFNQNQLLLHFPNFYFVSWNPTANEYVYIPNNILQTNHKWWRKTK